MTTTTTTSIAVTFLLLLSILSTSSASAFTPRQQLRPIVSAAKLAKRFRGTFAEFCSCDMLVDAAYIGVGAVTGAICRYQIGNIVTRKIQEHPRFSSFMGWHTAGINIMGSFVLGTLAGMPTVDPASAHEMKGITPRARLMAGVGFCGSFTTFSTFSVDVIGMLGKGETARALSYMALNNVGGIMAAFAGYNVAKRILSRRIWLNKH